MVAMVAVGRNVDTIEAPGMLAFISVVSASNDRPSEISEGVAIPGMSTLGAKMNTGVVFAMPLERAVRDVRFAETRTPPLSLVVADKSCCEVCDGAGRNDAACFSP